ncbi:reverse transcriptase domain-containing protein [Tanacetum coccineum]
MFRQTLSGATRNWFNDLDPKSVDNFEELSQKFLEEFSQQKRYAKDPMEIHGIKRRMNEVMDIRNWPKKLNDKIPKTVDEMFERVRAFIKGEAAAGKERTRGRSGPREFRKNMGTCAPYSRRDTFTPLTKTPKEILAMESVNFLAPPPLVGTLEKQNMNKFCDSHGDKGHNTNDCYHLKKQIEWVVAPGKLAHLVKDIR